MVRYCVKFQYFSRMFIKINGSQDFPGHFLNSKDFKDFPGPVRTLFKELTALGPSNLISILLQSGFDLLSKYSTMPTERLIIRNGQSIWNTNIISQHYPFNFKGRWAVWERPMLSGLEMKHLFVSKPFFTILNLNEMRIIPSVDHKEFPCVQGNTVPLRFLINYCTLINIFSTQLWLHYTHRYIHTHHCRFYFHLWIFVSETGSWAISII